MSKLEVVDPAKVDIERLRVRSKAFDAAKHLETDEDIADYLTDAFAGGDAMAVAHALGVAAQAKSMRQVADHGGLNEKSLYRALSEEGNPRLDRLLKVLAAVGVTLKAEARSKAG
jgi:probable addiction module antidote protein